MRHSTVPQAAVELERAAKYGKRFCMNYAHLITSNPTIRSGKPVIRDTRMTVTDVLEYLAGGMSEEEVLADFPYLTREDIRACLAFAAARERRILSPVP